MKHYWKLAVIVLLAAFLRLVELGTNPPGLYWDEVSLGYNAYSVLETGRDEHNEFLPYARFKAFGDYKPPGYIYATVPSVAVFGLNNFAVRFPSALAGTLLVLVTYFLVKELFTNSKHEARSTKQIQNLKKFKLFEFRISNFEFRETVALLAALFLAISPWSIQLSRVAFEANVAALFNALGVYACICSRRQPWVLVLSAISFVATIYTFNANRPLSLLLVLLLGLVFFKHLWTHKKQSLVAGLLGIFLVLPLVPHLRSTEGKLRWNEVNIFSDLQIILDSNMRIEADGGGRLGRLTHHRYLGYARSFLKHYFDHFGGRYLFLSGDGNPRFSLQDVGELYLIELPLLLVGVYALLKLKQPYAGAVLLGWFLIAPIPAAMARETPHALRTVSMLPVPQILIALGLVHVVSKLKKYQSLLIISYSLLLIGSLAYFQYSYYHYFPRESAGEWLTSYPRLVQYLQESQVAKDAKTITVVPDLGRPYIYFLFYTHYDPARFANEVDRTGDAFGFFTVNGFAKYRFERVDPKSIQSGDLYVVRAAENLDGFETLTTISETNGFEQFRVLKKT